MGNNSPWEGWDGVNQFVKFIKFVKSEEAGVVRLSPPWIRRGQGVVGFSVHQVHQVRKERKPRMGDMIVVKYR